MNPKALLILSVLMLSSVMIFSQKYDENNPDTKNYSLDGIRAQTINGEFTNTDNFLINRFTFISTTYDPTCTGSNANWTGRSSEDPYYDVYTFIANSNGFMDATLTVDPTSCCNIRDPYLMLYCDTFDPNDILQNLRATDDDGGIGFNSAFAPGDGIQIFAGQVYKLVVTNLGDINDFYEGPVPYELIINSDVTLGESPNNQVPISNWSLIIGIVAIVLVGLFAARRRL
jgi:hypothetical protein